MSREAAPELTDRIHYKPEEFLALAAEKWIKFQVSVWRVVNEDLEARIRRLTTLAWVFRVVIIGLSAAVTTMSDLDAVDRSVVTVVAGSLTALTGIEAYFRFGDRQSEIRRQQREVEALRDRLRFDWFSTVEIGDKIECRLARAKLLLQEGPAAYNEILNKYALKAERGDAPAATG